MNFNRMSLGDYVYIAHVQFKNTAGLVQHNKIMSGGFAQTPDSAWGGSSRARCTNDYNPSGSYGQCIWYN